MKHISIVTGCYNEEENVPELYAQIVDVFEAFSGRYTFELVIADNNSTDNTPQVLRDLARTDRRVKVIFNTRNFGPTRSGYNALMAATGDAAICMASDLQTPPRLIRDFLEHWEAGYKMVVAVKSRSEEPRIIRFLRSLFYATLARMSDVELISHFTGFGLYDKQVVDILRKLNDPYPYFRGLVSDIGFQPSIIEFTQPTRKHGKSKSNLPYLYEEAMLGVTSYTKLPLRLATVLGFVAALGSFLVGVFYLVYKLAYWDSFSLGTAPLTIGLFFLGSVQLVFLGILGEYVSMIHTQVLHRPLVYEKERLNF